jgi:acetyl-CoA carboxylase carboxyltransferase component
VALNSKHIGADFVFAWPMAKVGTMDAESAVKIMYSDEINNSSVANELIKAKTKDYRNFEQSPYKAAAHGYIDDVIEPGATRKRLIAVIDMLFTKYELSPDRKHRSV